MISKNKKDIRTVEKLTNLKNDTFDDRNMWLAPFVNPKYDRKDNQISKFL